MQHGALRTWALLLLTACSTPAVGAPCLPEQVPENGFVESETYIEASSVQCETRVCMVYRLHGDPRLGCVEPPPVEAKPGTKASTVLHCASADELNAHAYCTCRCDTHGADFNACACPSGFGCKDVLEQGGPGIIGGYCIKDGT